MTEFVEFATRWGVIVGYVTAFVAGLAALRISTLWARRISSIIVMIIAGFWLHFYLLTVNPLTAVVNNGVFRSRTAQIITSAGLFTMAFIIYRSEKYAAKAKANGGTIE